MGVYTVKYTVSSLGQYDEAIKIYRDTVNSYPDEVSTYFDMGLSLLCSDHYRAARRQYRSGLRQVQIASGPSTLGFLHVAAIDLQREIQYCPRLEERPETRDIQNLLANDFKRAREEYSDKLARPGGSSIGC